MRPDDFYTDEYRTLYGAMVDMRRKGQPIDLELLKRHFKNSDEWAAKIAEIAGSVPVAAHFRQYAQIVSSLAKCRRLRETGLTLAEEASKAEDPPSEILERAESRLATMRATSKDQDPISLADAALEATIRIDEIQERGKSAGIPTGLESFDSDMGGLSALSRLARGTATSWPA